MISQVEEARRNEFRWLVNPNVYLALLNINERSLSRKEEPTPFLKLVMLLPWDLPSTTLGTILTANKLASLRGQKCKSALGETRKLRRRKGLCGKMETSTFEIGCIFSLATPHYFRAKFYKASQLPGGHIHEVTLTLKHY